MAPLAPLNQLPNLCAPSVETQFGDVEVVFLSYALYLSSEMILNNIMNKRMNISFVDLRCTLALICVREAK